MATQNNRRADRWSIDKHIPVALIFTILAQAGGIIWWGSGVNHSVSDHEKRLAIQEASRVTERLAVLESQLKDSRELQLDISRKLDKLVDKK